MIRKIGTVAVLAAFLELARAAGADPTGDLGFEMARAVAEAGVAEARRLGAPGAAIAVVDAGGHLARLVRLEGTFPAAATVATEKARTAATFQKPTSLFEDAVNGGRGALLGVDVMTPLRGGVPVMVAGRVVGAVGVSGAASAAQDEEIAKVAAAAGAGTPPVAAAPSADPTLHFPRAKVDDAFTRGAPILENGRFKIHASRRDEPGRAEVHARDTDLIYVREGTATLVTGGRVDAPEKVAPDELRGDAIVGGTARTLVAGDVVVVPAGTPHWFRAVPRPFTYYVVKVTEAP